MYLAERVLLSLLRCSFEHPVVLFTGDAVGVIKDGASHSLWL